MAQAFGDGSTDGSMEAPRPRVSVESDSKQTRRGHRKQCHAQQKQPLRQLAWDSLGQAHGQEDASLCCWTYDAVVRCEADPLSAHHIHPIPPKNHATNNPLEFIVVALRA